MGSATDEKAQVALWRGMTTDKAIGVELQRSSAAVQQRFGDDAVRATLRTGGGMVEAASVPLQHRAALAAVSRTVHTLKEGEHASALPGRSRAAHPAAVARTLAGPEALSDSHEAAKYMPHPTLGLYLGLRHVQGHCLGSFEAVSRAAGDRVGESVFPLVL